MSRMTFPGWRSLATAAVAGAVMLGACADEEVLRPAPIEASVTVSSSASSGSGGGGGSFAKRTVVQRDPLGNLQKTRNLLWDGDFEWRPSFEDQYGWLYGPSPQQISFALPPMVMGADCKSGVKCAHLSAGAVLLGLVVASEGNELSVSVWSAPEDGVCTDLTVFLVSQGGTEQDVLIPAGAEQADEAGWCQHSAMVAERQSAQYLFIQKQNASTLVDDVSVEPLDGAQAKIAHNPPQVMTDKQRADRIRAWGRAATLPRITPPSEGQKRFEAHMRRRWGKSR